MLSLLPRLFNPITNAIKYNKPDGKISQALTATDSQNVFTICNSGSGIPAEDHPRIFGRFYGVGWSGRPRVDGIGLGDLPAKSSPPTGEKDRSRLETRT